MAISIISAPTEPPVPVPVSDCLEWCFQPDSGDVLETGGSFATVSVEFPSVPTIPANGTTFVIWGHTFTVDNTTDYTQNSFKVTATGSQSAFNFRKMLRANFFFTKTAVAIGGGGSRFTDITWLTCGEQDNFNGASMDFSGLEDAGATCSATNGTTPIFTNGYTMQARLMKIDPVTNVALPITKFEGFLPAVSCDSAGAVCINYMEDAKRTLYTPMPDLTESAEIDPDLPTMAGRFYVEYGWVYKDDNCQPISGEFIETDPVTVFDTVFPLEENLGMIRYIYDYPGGPYFYDQFLTNKPRYLALGVESFAWLWMAAGYQSLLPITNIVLRFNVFYKNGTNAVATVNYSPVEEYKVHCFNVSPKRVKTLFSIADLSLVSHYSVEAQADGGNYVGAETYFTLEHACENMVDVYFKTPPGGIGTLLCEVTEREVIQEGNEICLNTPCAETRGEKAKYSGRMLNNIRSYERITLTARRNFNPEELEYFRSLKASPERWIQVLETGLTGPFLKTYVAKRFLVDTGGVRIYQAGEYIDLVITGVIGDMPIQTPRNAA